MGEELGWLSVGPRLPKPAERDETASVPRLNTVGTADGAWFPAGDSTMSQDSAAVSDVEAPPDAEAKPFEDGDVEAIAYFKEAYTMLRHQLGKVIVGQDKVIDELLIAIFTRSHALLVGVPGLAKTLLISTLAQTMNLSFKRIQFTPDLMPSDITGTEVISQNPTSGERSFRFLHGPIFANVILADEINRTPPKTQAAMLESMQERKVTVGGTDHPLPDPFFVLATQNPVEQEGTYPLPEAQLDRFMFMIMVDYPSPEEEVEIMKRGTGEGGGTPRAILEVEHVKYIQGTVRRMPVADHVFQYAQRLVGATRTKTPQALDFCRKWLAWGAGPRASLNLILAAKAQAILRGQVYVGCDNVAEVAPAVLRHRLIPNFAAQSEGVASDDVVRMILEKVPKDQ